MPRQGNGQEMEDNKERYAQLRSEGRTPSECADILGMHVQTLYGYNKDPEVIERIEQLKLERRDLAGLDFGEQFRKWNELYRIALQQDNLKIAKECLEKIDSLGGFGTHGGGEVVRGQVRDKLTGGRTTNNLILFQGDNPNDTGQFNETLEKFRNIISPTKTSSKEDIIDITPSDDT